MSSRLSIETIPIARLFVSALNVRRECGDISELTNSIRRLGVLEPLLVRPRKDSYEVIVGKRRFMAAKEIGLDELPAIRKEVDDVDAVLISLTENLQRNNLTLEEEIESFYRLMKLNPDKYGSTRKLARAVGVSHVTISKRLAAGSLLKKLDKKPRVLSYLTTSNPERVSGNAIPIEHVQMLGQAVKSLGRYSIPKSRLQEFTREITTLTQDEVKRLIKLFRRYPQKSVFELKNAVLQQNRNEIATGIIVRCKLCNCAVQLIHEASGHKVEPVSRSEAPTLTP